VEERPVPTLEILSGETAGKTFSFSEEVKVGKDPSCLVRIDDPGVSRFHARIWKQGAGLQIEDLGSSNGTYVNFKKRAKGEVTPLGDKDIIFFGRTVTKLWVDAPEAQGGPSLELLRETVPVKGLRCGKCGHDLESELRTRIAEHEQVEVIRRLRLHELDDAALERLLAKAR
jgi:hypothetical protein